MRIDWYLQTVDTSTGQVVSEQYLYSSCAGGGGKEGGGGGGGSNGKGPTDAYPHKSLKRCPSSLKRGTQARTALESLFSESMAPAPHEVAIVMGTVNGAFQAIHVGTGTCAEVVPILRRYTRRQTLLRLGSPIRIRVRGPSSPDIRIACTARRLTPLMPSTR